LENENCPPEAIQLVADSVMVTNYTVAATMLGNPNCPAGAFPELVSSANGYIQLAIVKHPNCPPEILELLSHQAVPIREIVAANQRTPGATLERLLSDRVGTVSRAAAANPSLPRRALAMWQLAYPDR